MIDPPLGHLIVGPARHGVVMYAGTLAAAGDGRPRIVRAPGPHGLTVAAGMLRGAAAVHVPFTDRLFGDSCESAARAFCDVAAQLRALGAAVIAGLHDVPGDSAGPREARRRAAYRAVATASDGVVVCSHHEARRVLASCPRPVPVDVVPLAVPFGGPGLPVTGDGQVTVLGFLYPGKGHGEVLQALTGLPGEVGLVALGEPSLGHESLAGELRAAARVHARSVSVTGFVPEADLPAALAHAGVPVAPHRAVSASGSIATWLAHGRRPLVPDGAYVRELERRAPGTLWIYDDTVGLRRAITQALEDPSLTWQPAAAAVGPELRESAAALEHVLRLAALRARAAS